MQSKATTVEQYLAELPDDRRRAISVVREVILKNLDQDYEEGMQFGMIGYYVPHRVYSAGYHCTPEQPLPFVCLASQKNYMSLYLMTLYGDEGKRFQTAWAKTGKKLDMGKCCIRFKKLDDLPLEVIGETIRRMPARKYLAFHETCRESMVGRDSKPPKSAGLKKGTKKKSRRTARTKLRKSR
jgi:hypothetical protein